MASFLPHGKGLPQKRTDAVVAAMGGVEHERPDLLDIGESVVEYFGVSLDIDDLADELGVQADLQGVEQAALQDERDTGGPGGVKGGCLQTEVNGL